MAYISPSLAIYTFCAPFELLRTFHAIIELSPASDTSHSTLSYILKEYILPVRNAPSPDEDPFGLHPIAITVLLVGVDIVPTCVVFATKLPFTYKHKSFPLYVPVI